MQWRSRIVTPREIDVTMVAVGPKIEAVSEFNSLSLVVRHAWLLVSE